VIRRAIDNGAGWMLGLSLIAIMWSALAVYGLNHIVRKERVQCINCVSTCEAPR
jgi:hypothetical protein